MAAADRRAHDIAMAAHLKAMGDERTTSRCCLCFKMITVINDGFNKHLPQCVAQTPAGSTKNWRKYTNKTYRRAA